jgi:hypothetical protein
VCEFVVQLRVWGTGGSTLGTGTGVVVAGVMVAAVGVDAVDSRAFKFEWLAVHWIVVLWAVAGHMPLGAASETSALGTVLGTFLVSQFTEKEQLYL